PMAAPSMQNWTPTTPTLSAALAATLTVPETVVPLVGPVTDAVGACVSGTTLETVTLSPLDVVLLPAASRSIAVKVWAALVAAVVFQVTAYGATVSSRPRAVPST